MESNSSLFIKFNFLQHSNFKRYVQFEEEVNAMLVTFKCACRSSQPKMTKKLTHLSSFISAEMKAWRTSEEKPRREPRWSSSTPSICRYSCIATKPFPCSIFVFFIHKSMNKCHFTLRSCLIPNATLKVLKILIKAKLRA